MKATVDVTDEKVENQPVDLKLPLDDTESKMREADFKNDFAEEL